MNGSAAPETQVVVAMLGARLHYAVPRLLHDLDLLEHFYTDSYIGNKPLLRSFLRSLPKRVATPEVRRWLGREDTRLPPRKVTSFESLGIRYALARRRSRSRNEQDVASQVMAKDFNKAIVRHLRKPPDIVWGFNTAALELFEALKPKGSVCMLEQTMLPRRLEVELLAKEAETWSGWEPGFSAPAQGGNQAKREEQEWRLADKIIAGSDFVTRGLVECGVDPGKIHLVPYGVDAARFSFPVRTTAHAGPLRVLFVGQVGLRKGVPYLLEAIRELGPEMVHARFAGSVALDTKKLDQFRGVAEFLGAVPRDQMLELYQWAQVFVLPSIVEGSATASYEALMAGLPVIATSNTGTIVRDGIDGCIVPARNSAAIRDALAAYFSDRARLDKHSAMARLSSERAGLPRYASDLKQLFSKSLTQ